MRGPHPTWDADSVDFWQDLGLCILKTSPHSSKGYRNREAVSRLNLPSPRTWWCWAANSFPAGLPWLTQASSSGFFFLKIHIHFTSTLVIYPSDYRSLSHVNESRARFCLSGREPHPAPNNITLAGPPPAHWWAPGGLGFGCGSEEWHDLVF